MSPEKIFSPDIAPESQQLLAEKYQEIPTMAKNSKEKLLQKLISRKYYFPEEKQNCLGG